MKKWVKFSDRKFLLDDGEPPIDKKPKESKEAIE